MTTALITGITGQDGSYLADLLLAKGYQVHGIIRRSSSFSTQRIDHLYTDPHEDGRLHLHYGDLADGGRLAQIMAAVAPDEIYHLGAQSHVRLSFDIPEYTADIVALGTLRMLEAMRTACPSARFYQASSSEMFGNAATSGSHGYSETSHMEPVSPYAIAKMMAYQLAQHYRRSYGLHVSNGILFNHTSERRGETFVSRKITRAVGRIAAGLQDELFLGHLGALRDWGYAPEYMEAAWLMLQQGSPDDYVVGTGEAVTVEWFLHRAFAIAGLDAGDHCRFDPRYQRPTEVVRLVADATKARKHLGWSSRLTVDDIITRMVASDMELARREKHVGVKLAG